MNIVNNKKIAEFMGLVISSIPDKYWKNKSVEGFGQGQLVDLEYDTDWTWLMDVVSVIGNRKDSKMGIVTMFGLNRTRIQCYIKDSLVHDIDIMGVSSIDVTYNAIVEYIEWFNKNNSK